MYIWGGVGGMVMEGEEGGAEGGGGNPGSTPSTEPNAGLDLSISKA